MKGNVAYRHIVVTRCRDWRCWFKETWWVDGMCYRLSILVCDCHSLSFRQLMGQVASVNRSGEWGFVDRHHWMGRISRSWFSRGLPHQDSEDATTHIIHSCLTQTPSLRFFFAASISTTSSRHPAVPRLSPLSVALLIELPSCVSRPNFHLTG